MTEDERTIKENRAARIRLRRNQALIVASSGVKGDGAKVGGRCTLSEAQFVNGAAKKGWKLDRSGWPDFFCETPQGVLAVEVKQSIKDKLRPSQLLMFALLEALGLRIYVWSPDRPGELRTWQNHQAVKARRGAKRKEYVFRED
jgi:hypothetical protein